MIERNFYYFLFSICGDNHIISFNLLMMLSIERLTCLLSSVCTYATLVTFSHAYFVNKSLKDFKGTFLSNWMVNFFWKEWTPALTIPLLSPPCLHSTFNFPITFKYIRWLDFSQHYKLESRNPPYFVNKERLIYDHKFNWQSSRLLFSSFSH